MSANRTLKNFLSEQVKAAPAVESVKSEPVMRSIVPFEMKDARAALRLSHACESVTHLIRANAAAYATQSHASELSDIAARAEDLCAGIEAINSGRGFTPRDYVHMFLAYNVLRDHVGLPAVGMEAEISHFSTPTGRAAVGMESIEEFKEQVIDAQARAAEGSVDAIMVVYSALEDAICELKRRLISLSQVLPNVVYDETAQIPVDDYIFKQLAVNGQIPSDIASFFKSYGEVGAKILSSFSENALNTGSLLAKLPDEIAESTQGCVVRTIANHLTTAGDPRDSIDANQLCFDLPGCGPLFEVVPAGEGEVGEGEVGELIAWMQRFLNGPRPACPSDMGERASMEAGEDEDAATPDEEEDDPEGGAETSGVDGEGAEENAGAPPSEADAAEDASAAAADASVAAADAADAEAAAVASGDDSANVDPDSSPDANVDAAAGDGSAAAAGDPEGGDDAAADASGDQPPEENGEETVVETAEVEAPEVPVVQSPMVRVMTRETIGQVIASLIKVLDVVNVKSYAEARQSVWADIRSIPARAQAAVFQLSPSEASELRPFQPELEKYAELVFQMSALPAMHFLTNAVLAGYAFILFAERSIAGKKESQDDQVESTPDPIPEALQAQQA